MRALIPLLLLTLAAPAAAFETATLGNHAVKYVRDSVEYRLLTTQIYQGAEASVLDRAKRLKRNQAWAVVLDVDETVLDNSTYFLERQAYGLRFDWESWDAWCERRVAEPIPGAKGFVDAVRAAGGTVVWITNRHARTADATRDNLGSTGLWSNGDVLCMLTDDDAYTKRVRRDEVRTGQGACAVGGTPAQVLAYFGDTRHDLPAEGEDGAFVDDLGSRHFVLPNPLYGTWEHGVEWYRSR